MPEEGIETQEIKEALDEHVEHAEHAKHGASGGGHGHEEKASWIVQLSLSTALIAVLAAVAALQSGSYANDSIVQKNESILAQAKANDEWAYFQAKGIKAAIYGSQAETTTNTEAATKLASEAKREKDEQGEEMKKAQEFEKTVAEANEQSEHSLHIHHLYAKAVTIFQVAIALAAIAALTKRKQMWWVSLATGAVGVWFFVQGFGVG